MANKKNSGLGNNPLFKDMKPLEEKVEAPVLSEADVAAIKASKSDPTLNEYQRMTFIVKKELLEKLRDYAYTERKDLKIAINEALELFLADKTDLLKAPEKPKQTRTKKEV